jgi:hypothetical protein
MLVKGQVNILKPMAETRLYLGAFAKIAEQLSHVCPSVRPHRHFGSHWMDFHEI